MNLIGGESPPQGIENNWIASVQSRPDLALDEFWEAFNRGDRGLNQPNPITIEEINPNILSFGRLRLINEVIADLMGGAVDTGINPQTGDPH